MRDVNIRGNRNTVIDSSTGSGGGGFEGLAFAAITVFILAAVASAVAAALRAIEAIVMIIFYALAGGAALTVGAGLCYLTWRWRRPIGRALSHLLPSEREPQHQLSTPAYHQPITDGRRKVLVELDQADAERLRAMRIGEWR